MRKKQIMVSYSGSVNGEIIGSLLQLSDVKLKQHQTTIRKKKNIINILIECLQNVFYHADNRDGCEAGESQCCLLMIGKDNNNFYIISGNHIRKERVSDFKSKLDMINPMTPEELHELYLRTLDEGKISDKGGAGLGMMRILRESGQKVSYDFKSVDDQFDFFSMEVKVPA